MNSKKILAGVLALATLAGCGGTSSDTTTDKTEAEKASEDSLSGTVTASGSSALLPLAQAAADKFMESNPDLVITVNGGGSGEGLKQVADGSVDIGNSDVSAEEKLDADVAKTLTDHEVAIVAMAPVVNKDLGITSLTTDQLVSIFTGKVTNWKDVGGPDEEILLVTRPSSSGTRTTFKKWALNGEEEASNEALETDDSGTLVQTVSTNKGAIGYVALSYLGNNTDVQAVAIDGVEPTEEQILAGKYLLSRPFVMATKGDIASQNELVKKWFEYVKSDKGKEIIKKVGLIIPNEE